jgi:hypothetical protein
MGDYADLRAHAEREFGTWAEIEVVEVGTTPDVWVHVRLPLTLSTGLYWPVTTGDVREIEYGEPQEEDPRN